MLSWTKHDNGSATSRWGEVWFRISPSSSPVGWMLTWGSGEMELGKTLFHHRDDATEEAMRLAHSKELDTWARTPAFH
jgi:hypothetical protein